MTQPRRILDVERPAERHEPGVSHVPLGDRVGCPGHPGCRRWIVDRDDGFRLEAVIGFNQLVLFRLRSVELAERRFVDEEKCALSKEFSIIRNAAVFHRS